MAQSDPKLIQLVLVSHIAMDYVHGHGAGMGTVQKTECTVPGIVKNQVVSVQLQAQRFSREVLAAENVKTNARAHMLALKHALGMALGKVKRVDPDAAQFQKATFLSDSLKVVDTINHHIEFEPNSFQDVASENKRWIIKRIIKKVKKLSSYGLQVTIAVSDRNDKAGDKARTLARQKSRQAYMSRRQLQPAQDNSVEEQQDEISANGGSIELVVRTKTSSGESKRE